jgi:hypothetical protein
VEGGGWRVEGGGWRVEGGGWRVEGGGGEEEATIITRSALQPLCSRGVGPYACCYNFTLWERFTLQPSSCEFRITIRKYNQVSVLKTPFSSRGKARK